MGHYLYREYARNTINNDGSIKNTKKSIYNELRLMYYDGKSSDPFSLGGDNLKWFLEQRNNGSSMHKEDCYWFI